MVEVLGKFNSPEEGRYPKQSEAALERSGGHIFKKTWGVQSRLISGQNAKIPNHKTKNAPQTKKYNDFVILTSSAAVSSHY